MMGGSVQFPPRFQIPETFASIGGTCQEPDLATFLHPFFAEAHVASPHASPSLAFFLADSAAVDIGHMAP